MNYYFAQCSPASVGDGPQRKKFPLLVGHSTVTLSVTSYNTTLYKTLGSKNGMHDVCLTNCLHTNFGLLSLLNTLFRWLLYLAALLHRLISIHFPNS